MKWDASVRKKQIQLRAAGKNFDRDGVIGLLMDETIKSGQDEIEARFHELAVQRGERHCEDEAQQGAKRRVELGYSFSSISLSPPLTRLLP